MLALVLAISIAQASVGPTVPHDKVQHFAGAGAMAGTVYGFEAFIGAPKNVRMWNAILVPVGALVLRELWGNRDGWDFAAGCAGVVVAIPIILFVQHLVDVAEGPE